MHSERLMIHELEIEKHNRKDPPIEETCGVLASYRGGSLFPCRTLSPPSAVAFTSNPSDEASSNIVTSTLSTSPKAPDCSAACAINIAVPAAAAAVEPAACHACSPAEFGSASIGMTPPSINALGVPAIMFAVPASAAAPAHALRNKKKECSDSRD